MKILFVEPHAYIPQLYGGVQASTDQLCRALLDRGHKVAVLSGISRGGFFAWKALFKMRLNNILAGHKVARDQGLGYAVWRTWFPEEVVEYIATQEKPDLIVAMTGKVVPVIVAAKRTGLPILVQLNDVALHAHGGDFAALGHMPCVANSHFTADTFRRAFGLTSDIIYPFMSLDKYKTETSRTNVTFINPIEEKGRDIALAIAMACPDIPFSFIESLPLDSDEDHRFVAEVSALKNVTMIAQQGDMRNVYGKCKILLAPSLCEEAYGRVATEAQINGIPVVASARGGLPEAVGEGGILIPVEAPIAQWVEAVHRLWQDKDYYDGLSAAALKHANRPEMDFIRQVDAHEKVLLKAAGKT